MEKIKRFLIVTENEEHGGFFRGMLRERQVQDVSVCLNATEAMQLIEAKRVQFVIMEREMQKMSGSLLIQKIHAERVFTYLPCLLFSAQMSDESIRLAKELGKDVLKVPLIKEQVWPVIEAICKREEAIDAAELELRQAEGAIVDKQFSVALEMIRQATKATGQTARSLGLTGEAYFHLEDYPKAEKALEAALQQRQSFYQAMQLLAKVYSRTSRHQKAINLLTSMADASPVNINSLLALGAACSAGNQIEKAKEILSRVRNLDPGNKAAAAELGKIAFREGDVAKAESFLAEADDAAELGRFFNNLAIGMVSKGELNDAVRTYEAAMRILKDRDPDNMIFLQYNLGIAMKKQGNHALAFALLAACCVANPNYDRAYASLIGVVRSMQEQHLEFDKALLQKIQKQRPRAS